MLRDVMYRISVDKNRPDFRVFIDLLYGAGENPGQTAQIKVVKRSSEER